MPGGALKQATRPAERPVLNQAHPRADYKNTPDDYRKLLQGKRVIVVGPAGYMHGRHMGAFINSFDLVVKLNWGETLEEVDFGRTDILYKRLLKLGHADEILIQEYLDARIKFIVAVDHPHAESVQYLAKVVGNRIPWFVDNSTRIQLTREIGNSALIGPVAIRHLLLHEVKSVHVIGCDFYQTGYALGYGGKVYRDYMKRRDGEIGPTHDAAKQIRWLGKKQKEDRRLNFDEVLTKLVESPPLDKSVVERVAVIIPARFASSRFPGKPLAEINGKPMILHVCERVRYVIPRIYVATDHKKIAQVVRDAGFKAIMTEDAMTGTDRVAAAAQHIAADFFVNVQGDEPLLDPPSLLALIEAKTKNPKDVINAMTPLAPGEAESRDVVKAVVDAKNHLLYASRAAVPMGKEGHQAQWKQLGLYVFNRRDLAAFMSVKKRAPIEAAEDVEILRFLELGIPVRMVKVEGSAQSVDTPEHIKIVEKILNG